MATQSGDIAVQAGDREDFTTTTPPKERLHRVNTLPTSGYEVGGVYFVRSEGKIYIRTESGWECFDKASEADTASQATAIKVRAAAATDDRPIPFSALGTASKTTLAPALDANFTYNKSTQTLNVPNVVSSGLNANSSKITKVATPTASTDAANKAYVDGETEYLNTMVNQSVQINSQVFTNAEASTARKNIKIPDFVTFTELSELTSTPSSSTAYAFYIGSSSNIVSSPITINSGWKMIDFNGMTLNVSQSSLPATSASIIKGHSHCVIKNLTVSGTWTVNTNVANNIIDTLAGGENIVIDVTFNGSKYGRGFHSCQRLDNCKVTLGGSAMVEGHYYNYCEYLNNCRCAKAGAGASIGFYNCMSMTNCDVFNGACSKSPITNCSNYTNVSYYINGERKYFSDTTQLTVNGTDTNKFFDECKRDADEADRTGYNRILYIKPGGAFSSWPMANSALNNSICYRDSAGSIKVNDGHSTGTASTVDYVDSSIASIKPVKSIKINGTTKTPNGSGLVDLGTISGGGSVTTDTSMSSTSTNPVQNKVIKSYVDSLVGTAITQLAQI